MKEWRKLGVNMCGGGGGGRGGGPVKGVRPMRGWSCCGPLCGGGEKNMLGAKRGGGWLGIDCRRIIIQRGRVGRGEEKERGKERRVSLGFQEK